MTKIDSDFLISLLHVLKGYYPHHSIEVWDGTIPYEKPYLQRIYCAVGSHRCFTTIMNDYDADYHEVAQGIANLIDREMKGDSNG